MFSIEIFTKHLNKIEEIKLFVTLSKKMTQKLNYLIFQKVATIKITRK